MTQKKGASVRAHGRKRLLFAARSALLRALVTAMLFCAAAETPAPPVAVANPGKVAEAALPVMTLIASCPSFASFEGAPPEALASEVQCFGDAFLECDSALFIAFACPPETASEAAPPASLIPTMLEIESAIDTGTGRVRVSVRASQDFGFGYEFGFYADFTLLPDASAPFGARVESVFIPE